MLCTKQQRCVSKQRKRAGSRKWVSGSVKELWCELEAMHCASVHDTALNCTVYSEHCIMQCTVHSVYDTVHCSVICTKFCIFLLWCFTLLKFSLNIALTLQCTVRARTATELQFSALHLMHFGGEGGCAQWCRFYLKLATSQSEWVTGHSNFPWSPLMCHTFGSTFIIKAILNPSLG